MHPSGCVSPRQGPKNWAIFHQIALFQKFGPFRQSWAIGNFCYIDRFEDLTPPHWSYNLFVGQGTILANSVDWAARYSHLKGAKRINNILRSKIKFPLRTYYSSSRKGFPSHVIIPLEANAHFRVREPPAGPKKSSYISPDGTFPKIWPIIPDTCLPIAQPKVIALEHLPHQSKAITQRKVLPDSQRIL